LVHTTATTATTRAQAAADDTASLSLELWERIEGQYKDVASSETQNLEDKLQQLFTMELPQPSKKNTPPPAAADTDPTAAARITKSDLINIIVPWKFSVGKPRPALWKLLQKNTNEQVQTAVQTAIQHVQSSFAPPPPFSSTNHHPVPSSTDISEAIQCLTNSLSGVGPATASVILTQVRPDLFCYMYDEVIDTFASKRTYTIKVYLQCQKHCYDIATALNQGGTTTPDTTWTCARVARTLWIAARVHATITATPTATTLSSSSSSESRQRLIDYTLCHNNEDGTNSTTKKTNSTPIVKDDDDDVTSKKTRTGTTSKTTTSRSSKRQRT
jgi:hypothetical protein